MGNGGSYSHLPLTAVLHYDTMGVCAARGPILTTYLCTQQGVQVNTEMAPYSNYYSYTNAVNPFPCAEAAVGAAYSWMEDTVTDIDLSDAPPSWVPYETLEACSYQYLASVEAYGEYWFKSYLWSQNEERDVLFTAIFFAMWGLNWIHSTYPFYPEAAGPSSLS